MRRSASTDSQPTKPSSATPPRASLCAGVLANQGGPLWWGSNHRCHHAHCEKERDPHSAKVDGDTTAFSFFDNPEHKWVDEDFVPRHIDRLSIR